MADRTQLYQDTTTGTPFDVTTDERTVPALSGGAAAKVQYVAEIDGTPDSPNVSIIDDTGAKKVFLADGANVTDGAKADTAWDLAAAAPSKQSIFKKMATLLESVRALLAGTITVNTGLSPLTDAQLRATPIIVDTEFGATIPISAASLPLPTGAATQATLASLATTDGALADATWDGAAASPTKQSILRALWTKLEAIRVAATDAALVQIVQPQALTKGTQGALGFTTQDLKDAGRTPVTFSIEQFNINGVSEMVMNTAVVSEDFGAELTGQTTYACPAGKRFRITSMVAQQYVVTGNTGQIPITLKMRVAKAGTAVIGSPRQIMFGLGGISASPAVGTPVPIPVPDGFELGPLDSFLWTVTAPGYVVTTNAPKVNLTMTGYLY